MSKLGSSEIILIFVSIVSIGIMLIPQIFYLKTLQKTLNEVSKENRKIKPNLVWLVLIPFFGFIWHFVVVNGIAISLQAEFRKRSIKITEDKPGYSIGLTYCILFCFIIVPFIGVIAGIAGFVCWIMYWIKINNYKIKL